MIARPSKFIEESKMMEVTEGKSQSPLISVVIPCHNVGSTIRGTVRSAVRQTHANVEVLCVENGSEDDTFEVLKSLTTQHDCVCVIRMDDDFGPGSARNIALRQARGEYIAFLDGDDHLEPDFFSEMLSTMIIEDADIVQCAIRYVFEDRNYIVSSPAGQIKGEHCLYRLDMNDGLPFVFPQLWNKLYKRHVLDGLEIKNIVWEDAEVMPQILSRCKKIITIDDALINYNKRFSNLTGTGFSEIERAPRYFSDALQSIQGQASEHLREVRQKWAAPLPRCTHQNIANFLRVADQELKHAPSDMHSEFAQNFQSFLTEAQTILQKDYAEWAKFIPKLKNLRASQIDPVDALLQSRREKPGKRSERFLSWLERHLATVDRFAPKKQNLWLFANWGHYNRHTMDNPRAIFEEIKGDPSLHKVILVNDAFDPTSSLTEGENVEFVPLHSRKALKYLIQAGTVVVGYSIHNIFGYRRLIDHADRRIIQAWHGIPIKRVGFAVGRNKEPFWANEAPRYRAIPCSSETDRATMIDSFAPGSPDKIILSGLPRHDFLAMSDDQLPEDYREHTAHLHDRLQGRQLVLFAPTWRIHAKDRIQFSLEEMKQLDWLFARHNAVMGFRLHRNMVRHKMTFPMASDNIIQMTDTPDVNIILRACDAVITDYSSIYLDAMAIRKPVFLYTPDIHDYGLERGLNYSTREFLPHDQPIDRFDTLIAILEGFLKGEIGTDAAYEDVHTRFHKWGADGHASRRLIEAVSRQ